MNAHDAHAANRAELEDEGDYNDAIGSLVIATRHIARLTHERDEARAVVRAVEALRDEVAACVAGGPCQPCREFLDRLEIALGGGA